MTKEELALILGKHKKWLNDDPDGKRAYLSDADLRRVDLRGADLSDADMRGANMRGADMRSANLSGADLSGANLDFSCLPLWCGSLSAHFDDRQIIQLIYHTVKSGLNSKNTGEEVKNELTKLIDLANRFHRADECGRITTF